MRLFQVVSEVDDRSIAVDGEGKTVGQQVDDEYADWSFTEDYWRIEDDFAHNGSQSTSVFVESNQNRTGTYTIPNTHWSDKAEFYAWLYMPNDDSDNNVTYLNFNIYDSTGSKYVEIRVVIQFEGGINTIAILSRYAGGSYVNEYGTIIAPENWGKGNWFGIRMTAEISNQTFSIYIDTTDSGTWTLTNTYEIPSDFTTPWKTIKLNTWNHQNKANTGYDEIYIDEFTFIAGPTTGQEITPAPISANCSKKMMGRGVFNAVIRDKELANYSTTKDYVWSPIEVWKNDLSVKLGEYFAPRPTYKLNSYLLSGPEAFGVLSQVNCNYNGILASGESTAIGADTMTDALAAFTDALLTKVCMFTDKLSPSIDTDYPTSDTDHLLVADDNPVVPWQETGAYTDLDTPDGIWFLRSEVGDDYYLKMVFDVTNGAAATAFAFTMNMFNSTWGSGGTAASIWIYDFTNVQWRKVVDLTNDGIWITYNMSDADIPAGVISDYYSGDAPPEFHVKIIGGTTAGSTTTTTRWSFAQLKTTYSTIFAAEQNNYVIDGRTATVLTFTGQTPEDDGVDPADRYIVGDYLHNVINNIGQRVAETNLTFDYDTSTNADAADYRTSTVGNIFNSFAKMDGRRSWQQIGWVAQSLSTYVATGLTLTENDLVVNKDMEGWEILRDGTQMRRHQMVVGNGNFAEGTQTPDYPCPQSFLLSSNLLSSQVVANTRMTNLLADNQSPKDIFICTIDYDNNNDVDFSVLDVGKTININLFSGTFTITNGLIISQEFDDSGANGHLLCTIEVETI